MFTPKLAIAAVVLVGGFAAALIVGNRVAAVDQPGGTVVIEVGRSPSEQATAADMAACARSAIDIAVKRGATLFVAPVGPASSAVWKPVATRLSGPAKSNPVVAKREQDRSRAAAGALLARVMAAPAPAHGSSDVFAGASSAGRLLQREPGPRTLVLCDDMHAVGSGLNLYKDDIAPSRCGALTSRLRPLWGDLRGVAVAAGAAGLDTKGEVGAAREAEIETFWTRCWARAVGASSMTYDSLPHF